MRRDDAGVVPTLSLYATILFLAIYEPMEIIAQIAIASWRVFQEAALYILLGFLIAGILRVYFQPDSVAHYFHRGRFRSVVYAALLGIPLPL